MDTSNTTPNIIQNISAIFVSALKHGHPIFDDPVASLSLYSEGTRMQFYNDCITVAIIYETMQTTGELIDLFNETLSSITFDEYQYEIAETIYASENMHDWKRSLGSYGASIGNIVMEASEMSKRNTRTI